MRGRGGLGAVSRGHVPDGGNRARGPFRRHHARFVSAALIDAVSILIRVAHAP